MDATEILLRVCQTMTLDQIVAEVEKSIEDYKNCKCEGCARELAVKASMLPMKLANDGDSKKSIEDLKQASAIRNMMNSASEN